MIGALIPLLVLGGIVAGIVTLVRRRRDDGATGGGEGELRRLFLYGLLFVALVLTASGATGLLELAIPDSTVVAGDDTSALARNLAFVIVAGPVYGLLWWSIRRRVGEPEERGSFSWAAYVGVAQLTALVVAMTGLTGLLAALLPPDEPFGPGLARLVIWGAVWGWHWWLFRSPVLSPTQGRRIIPIGGSGIGLGVGAVSIGVLLAGLFGSAYDAMFSEAVATGGAGDGVWWGVAWAVPGVAAWAWYWLAHAARDERTRLWHAYTLLLGVLVPIITLLSAVGTAVALALVWLLGDPNPDVAARWFDPVPGALAAALVAAAVWAYHRLALGTSPDVVRTEPGRAYRYLMAGAGLLASAVGIAAIVSAALQALARPAASESPVNTVLYGLTALAVGLPVWWSTWRRAQAAVVADPAAEVRSPSRRIYLTLSFGVVGLVALVSLVVVVYQVVVGALEGTAVSVVVDQARVAAGILLAAGAVGAYHWTVWKADRSRAPHEEPSRLRHVLLVGGADADHVAVAVRERTGAHVAVWHRLDDGEATLDTEAVLARLAEVDEPRVLVVAEPSGPDVIPYRP